MFHPFGLHVNRVWWLATSVQETVLYGKNQLMNNHGSKPILCNFWDYISSLSLLLFIFCLLLGNAVKTFYMVMDMSNVNTYLQTLSNFSCLKHRHFRKGPISMLDTHWILVSDTYHACAAMTWHFTFCITISFCSMSMSILLSFLVFPSFKLIFFKVLLPKMVKKIKQIVVYDIPSQFLLLIILNMNINCSSGCFYIQKSLL